MRYREVVKGEQKVMVLLEDLTRRMELGTVVFQEMIAHLSRMPRFLQPATAEPFAQLCRAAPVK
jgi:hypothetical protein